MTDPIAIFTSTLNSVTPVVGGFADGIEEMLRIVRKHGPLLTAQALTQVDNMNRATIALETFVSAMVEIATRSRVAVDELRALHASKGN